MGGQEQLRSFAQDDHCVVGAAEAPGGPDHRLQDRLHVGRRLRDGTRGSRQWRSAAPATRCSSVNSRTFSMAITAWAAKVSSSWICCGVKGPGSTLRRTTAADGSAVAHQRCSDRGAEAVLGCEPARSRELGRIERRDVRQVARPGIEYGAATGSCPVERTARTRAVVRGPSWRWRSRCRLHAAGSSHRSRHRNAPPP